MRRTYNFSGGMGIFPGEVVDQIKRSIHEYRHTGLSVLELSHRSAEFHEIVDRAEDNIRRLLGVPSSYSILFLQGGASLQFSMVPMHLLRNSERPANYVVSGYWSKKAVREAQREGEVRIVWNGESERFRRCPNPDELIFDDDAAYLHYASNETVEGIQFQYIPTHRDVPVVCDMCSDFLTKPIDISRFGIVYAHAQKNAGIAGATVVIVRNDLLSAAPDDLHSMLDYRSHVEMQSIYNTAPTVAIYVIELMTRWLIEDMGGLDAMHASSRQRAGVLYRAIDESDGFYRGRAEPESRSLINVTFDLPTRELEEAFIAEAAEQGLVGLRGHRSTNGIRASLFNPMPMAGVLRLVEFMQSFCQHSRKHVR